MEMIYILTAVFGALSILFGLVLIAELVLLGKMPFTLLRCKIQKKLPGFIQCDDRTTRVVALDIKDGVINNPPDFFKGKAPRVTPEKVLQLENGQNYINLAPHLPTGYTANDVGSILEDNPAVVDIKIEALAEARAIEKIQNSPVKMLNVAILGLGFLVIAGAFGYLILQYAGNMSLNQQCIAALGRTTAPLLNASNINPNLIPPIS